jgi:hypothetical protein
MLENFEKVNYKYKGVYLYRIGATMVNHCSTDELSKIL